MRLLMTSSIVIAMTLSVSAVDGGGGTEPGGPGPYAIGHSSFLLIDTTRNADSSFGGRPVPVSVWYPADPSSVAADAPPAVYALDPFYGNWPSSTSSDWEQFGMPAAYEAVPPSADKPFPLVVVSPGWSTRYYALLFYAERLASHGFIVALTQHFHDGTLPWDPLDGLDVAMLNRPRDVSFMLDGLMTKNGDPSDVLFNSMRPDLVAASGHSLGGYAAMALAGGDDAVCASLADPLPSTCNSLGSTLPDPRIKAIVPLDGSNQVLHFSELARIGVPTMAVGQAWENVGTWQARQHAAISGRPSYRADVRGAVHASFTNDCTVGRVLYSKGIFSLAQLTARLLAPQCSTALDQREVNRLVAMYAVAFLKTHLARDTGYQEVLTPGWALTVERNVEFFVTEPSDARALGEDPCCFRYFPHQPGSTTERAERDPAIRPAIEIVRDW